MTRSLQSLGMSTLAVFVLLLSPAGGNAKDLSARNVALADIEKTLGFVPEFLSGLPEQALPGAWEEMKTLQMSKSTALPPKIKELIGLGVASQIPCRYCIQAHTEFAKANGATRAEIGLAVAEAGLSRHWSTFLNGVQADEGKFRMEIQRAVDIMTMSGGEGGAESPMPAGGTDAVKALTQAFGGAPEFLKSFPPDALPAAARTMIDIEMNPNGALESKYVSLISLAVASQVPCRYCIIADTEFGKAAGASDREIAEAIAMASFTREMSTMLNGMQVDEARFQKDLARLVKGHGSQAQAARSKKK
jgi:AhpD family alkylhydroperoxidase